LLAVAIGAGLIFSVNESIRTGQGLPRGLFVVAYNVTVPTVISAVLGVYVTLNGLADADGELNVPVPELL
jgi:hypothetical protein